MRLKPGRPDIARYPDLFSVPAARPDTPLAVSWLGVTTLLLDDGSSALMTDGFFSRPSLIRVATRAISPSTARVDGCLARANVTKLAAVIALHTHFDHAMDSALVADRTGALLVGSVSAANLGRGYGLPSHRIVVAESGQPLSLGSYEVTLFRSAHCPPDRFPGSITTPITPPAPASAYRCGEAWSTLVNHQPSGQRLLIQGSAGFLPDALVGQHADIAYLGVGQLGVQQRSYLVEYWNQTVRAVGARRVVLIHWDDFFRPLSKPLRALPYIADDLDATIRICTELAALDGIQVQLPTVWQRADPFSAEQT